MTPRERQFLWLGARRVPSASKALGASEVLAGLRDLNLDLPSAYVEFLKCRGGVPTAFRELTAFPCDGIEGSVVGVGVMFGIAPNGSNSLADNRRAYQGVISDGYFPIGDDPGGNLICLSLPNGRVGFWNHHENQLYPVAGSFEAFLDCLFMPQRDDPQPWLSGANPPPRKPLVVPKTTKKRRK